MIKKYDRFAEADKADTHGDYEQAYRLFKELAIDGDAIAMTRLALMYYAGKFVTKQLKKAIFWNLEAVRQGSSKGLMNLAYSYRDLGDIARYKYYLEKAMALGNDSAAFDLAKLYNISVKERLQVQALLLLVVTRKNATDGEIEEAKAILARLENEQKLATLPLLFKSNKLSAKKARYLVNVETDSKKVRQQLAKAAEYLDKHKYKKARLLLEQLAEEGCAKAMDYLGAIYLYGMGVIVNSQQAIKWYSRAVRKGSFESQLNLAIAYRHTPDIQHYKQHSEYALASGDDNAALLLAQLYNVSDHETERVEALLEQVMASDKVDADAIYQAQSVLQNLINPYNYINKQILA